MTDGGAIAKSRFRFQDICAIYFSLKEYVQQSTNLDYIYCEQDKLDFEIWSHDSFSGYQVKNIKNSIKATEVNSILEYYINKAEKSRKHNRNFYFIFAQKPKNSLHYLLLKLSKNIGIKKYHKPAEKYIKTALDDLTINDINIDYHCYNIEEIEYLACDLSRRILKNKLNSDFPSEVIQDFLSRLRDEIDIISSRNEVVSRFCV